MTAPQLHLELQLTHNIHAPLKSVWRVWTDEDALRQWFCPADCQQLDGAFNVRVGGPYRFTLQCKGKEYTAYGSYLDVTPMQRIVFTHQWEQPNSPETRCTATFIPQGDQTQVQFHQSGLATEESVQSHRSGWASVLDQLSEHLTGSASREAG